MSIARDINLSIFDTDTFVYFQERRWTESENRDRCVSRTLYCDSKLHLYQKRINELKDIPGTHHDALCRTVSISYDKTTINRLFRTLSVPVPDTTEIWDTCHEGNTYLQTEKCYRVILTDDILPDCYQNLKYLKLGGIYIVRLCRPILLWSDCSYLYSISQLFESLTWFFPTNHHRINGESYIVLSRYRYVSHVIHSISSHHTTNYYISTVCETFRTFIYDSNNNWLNIFISSFTNLLYSLKFGVEHRQEDPSVEDIDSDSQLNSYNIDNSFHDTNNIQSTTGHYGVISPKSPIYSPNSPVYNPTHDEDSPTSHYSPVYDPTNDTYSNYNSINPYSPRSPVYNPSSPVYNPASPVYNPINEVYSPTSPVYSPTSPIYNPTNEGYSPTSPIYSPSRPIYDRTVPVCSSANNTYSPISGTHSHTISAYSPTRPFYTTTNTGISTQSDCSKPDDMPI